MSCSIERNDSYWSGVDCAYCEDGRNTKGNSLVAVELNDELALAFSVLRVARTPVVVLGDGSFKDSLSSPDVDSPIRWGQVVAASDLWVWGITDDPLSSCVHLFRSIALEDLARTRCWGFDEGQEVQP